MHALPFFHVNGMSTFQLICNNFKCCWNLEFMCCISLFCVLGTRNHCAPKIWVSFGTKSIYYSVSPYSKQMYICRASFIPDSKSKIENKHENYRYSWVKRVGIDQGAEIVFICWINTFIDFVYVFCQRLISLSDRKNLFQSLQLTVAYVWTTEFVNFKEYHLVWISLLSIFYISIKRG